jgi:transcriptional regulator with PAS, ATPase and Fis domain
MRRIVGQSPALMRALDRLSRYALSSGPLLILGETGVGKELAALAAHELGPRKDWNFVPVNCGAIPDALLESELFGYAKGAFTGASHDHRGKFELADRGTIFLDEIGNTSLAMQAKLLRVLDEGEVCRLGDNQSRKVNVRVVSATNCDLTMAVKEGRFRADLLYRLGVHQITLPPLRSRDGDIPLLLQDFLDRYATQQDKAGLTFSAEVKELLLKYEYPGNVRELSAIVLDAVVLADLPTIKVENLPAAVLAPRTERATPTRATPTRSSEKLSDVESAHAEAVLSETAGNKKLAAARLGISRNKLSRIIKKRKLSPVGPVR